MTQHVSGRLLRQARDRAGIRQLELARRAGVPQPVISAYERGRREPSVAALARLLRAAGFELTLAPAVGPDPIEASRTLADLLDLADALPPPRKGTLHYPRLP